MRFQIDQHDNTTAIAAPTKGRPARPETRLLDIESDQGVHRASLIEGSLRALDTHKLRSEIAALGAPGNPPTVVLSMRGVDSISMGCLGSIAQLSGDLERVGGVIVLYSLPKEIARVLKKTRLDRLILTARSRPHARRRALATRKRLTQHGRNRAA